MNKINIIIADSDELYLNSLANYIIEKTNIFELVIFTLKDSLIRYIDANEEKIDIILVNKNFLCNELINSKVKVKLLLSEDMEEVAGYDVVTKYQKTEHLIKEIMIKYAEYTGNMRVISGQRKTKFIGVYSPIGGSGKTTLALGVSVVCANAGLRTFYLNLEKIDSTGGILSRTPGSISDVFLAIKTNGGNPGLKILSSRGEEPNTGIHYISGAESLSEYSEIDTEDIRILIETFENLGEYDIVVIDFSSEFTNEKINLLDCCDLIFAPILLDGFSIQRINLLFNERNLHNKYDSIFEKMHLVINKADFNTNQTLLSSGILNYKNIEMIVEMSPILADQKKIFNSMVSIRSILNQALEIIQKS